MFFSVYKTPCYQSVDLALTSMTFSYQQAARTTRQKFHVGGGGGLGDGGMGNLPWNYIVTYHLGGRRGRSNSSLLGNQDKPIWQYGAFWPKSAVFVFYLMLSIAFSLQQKKSLSRGSSKSRSRGGNISARQQPHPIPTTHPDCTIPNTTD